MQRFWQVEKVHRLDTVIPPMQQIGRSHFSPDRIASFGSFALLQCSQVSLWLRLNCRSNMSHRHTHCKPAQKFAKKPVQKYAHNISYVIFLASNPYSVKFSERASFRNLPSISSNPFREKKLLQFFDFFVVEMVFRGNKNVRAIFPEKRLSDFRLSDAEC